MSILRSILQQIRYHGVLYLFALPSLCMIALFQYYPALSGIYHSVYRWNGADISEWVAFKNFTDLLSNVEFWISFKVALMLGCWNVVKMVPAVLVAVCLNRVRSQNVQFLYRILFVAPMVIPGLVIVLIWRSFFFEATSGYLNQFLHVTGLFNVLVWLDGALHWGGIFMQGREPAWLGDPRLILVACVVWGFPWVGSFAVLTYLAKLQAIGREIYEAAEIDGANWFTKFTRIEIPLIMSSVHLLLVFVIIDTIKDAGMVLALAGMAGGPGGVATVPALFMIRKAFIDQQMGYACAVGLILTAIVMFLQKLSTWVMNWDSLKPWQRTTIRSVAIGAGVWMLVTFTLLPLAVVILFLAVPWGALLGRTPLGPKANIAKVSDADIWKPIPPLPVRDPTMVKLQDFALRAAKHGFILAVLGFALLPLYLMIVVSLKTNQQFYEAPTTLTVPRHWENWSLAWAKVMPALANSIFVASMSTMMALFLAIGAAYFFARRRMPMSGLLWNLLLILMMMPTIANLIPLFRLLQTLHLINTLTALILVGAAGGQAFAIYILRNSIQDIPKDLFEAAEIDGAPHFQQVRHVVLPIVAPILGTIGVMHFIGQWNDFVLPLIVIGDQERLPVMVTLLRMAGEYIKDWGQLMAGYTLASLPIIFLFILCMRLFTRGLTEGAVKG